MGAASVINIPKDVAKRLDPVRDNVIIQLDKPAGVTASGLILPEKMAKPGAYGRVVKIGPGRRTKKRILIPLTVQPGDIVILPKFTDPDHDERIDGEKFLIGRESELLGIVGRGVRVSIV